MRAILILLLTIAMAVGAEPKREAGLSVYMLPERVATLGGKQGGFVVTDPKTSQPEPATSDPRRVITYLAQLAQQIQTNGIWIVTTDPNAYSEGEWTKLKDLISLCAQKNIPVYTCRASELPKGWQRAR